ncbi:protein of unknown function DUF497 [[Leptolyngbya] sp. PCC 7376]|uniref:BrnT family toxin n=1 Tax=[Leptolyngbya] sp. PCC 7376 TaxID=111781 RepID=UPI00029EC873|nr:BrnT family toxin [[Leptolyngbya] sp. PCC 7376]AFY40002.1 protein of unknown function DUF497 [[Leptolyngbya] sp. PCC 7376]
MKITWDKKTAAINFQTYGLHFSDVVAIFYDSNTLELGETLIEGGRKYIAIGIDQLFRTSVIAYDFHDSHIKIMSARLATPSEKYMYETRIRF